MIFGELRRSPIAKTFVVFVFATVIIAARRWPQLVSPDVWVEDGTQIIPSFVKLGWAGLFVPVNGYLLVPAKLITYVGLTLSFEHYALVSTVLAIAVQAAVVAAIAVSPTILTTPTLAALLVPVLPIGSEVYALPLFVFWWTTLLLFVGLFWRDGQRLGVRIIAIIVGGLSSPFITVAWPIFALRLTIERTRGNLTALVMALVLASIQGFLLLTEHARGVTPLDAIHHLPTLISKYFGTALYSVGQHGAGVFGIGVLIFLVAATAALPYARRLTYVMLGLCLAAAIITSISRVSVDAPHPLLAGPRYFFFPVILTGWMLIMLAIEARRSVGLAAMAIAGAYAPSLAAAFLFEPQIAKKPWNEQVNACMAAPEAYTFDIQVGLPQISWSSTMEGDDCRKLNNRALF